MILLSLLVNSVLELHSKGYGKKKKTKTRLKKVIF